MRIHLPRQRHPRIAEQVVDLPLVRPPAMVLQRPDDRRRGQPLMHEQRQRRHFEALPLVPARSVQQWPLHQLQRRTASPARPRAAAPPHRRPSVPEASESRADDVQEQRVFILGGQKSTTPTSVRGLVHSETTLLSSRKLKVRCRVAGPCYARSSGRTRAGVLGSPPECRRGWFAVPIAQPRDDDSGGATVAGDGLRKCGPAR
jgi:hypothetical protein